MGDDQTTYQQLAARFPASAHKTKPGSGGKALMYVDGEMVISRLNAVPGFVWSFRVVNQGVTEVEAWVLGEMTATFDGVTVVRQQYGAQELMRGSRTVTDLFKSAATDAIKKCATTLGVGLYLYDEEERSEVEAEMRAEQRARSTPAAAPDPTVLKTKVELWADLQTGIAYARSLGLDPAEPDPARMNRADIEAVIAALRTQCRTVLAERKQTAS